MMHRQRRRPWWWPLLLLADIKNKIDRVQSTLEEFMAAQQEQLDALVARIDTAVEGIRGDIQSLKDAHPEVDFTALEQRVAGLEGLDAENPAPAEG